MSKKSTSASAKVCVVCMKPLPPETNYCIGCGVQHDDGSAHVKAFNTQAAFERRLEFWRFIGRVFGGWGIFRR